MKQLILLLRQNQSNSIWGHAIRTILVGRHPHADEVFRLLAQLYSQMEDNEGYMIEIIGAEAVALLKQVGQAVDPE